MTFAPLLRRAALALAATLSLGSAQAAMLTVNAAGTLTGATNVDVGGTAYDVQFVDGSCNAIFGGCLSSLFAFSSQPTAIQASQALLAQVFLDGSLGQFDSVPSLTNGCTAATQCVAATPYMTYVATNGVLSVAFMGARNAAPNSGFNDGLIGFGISTASDTSTDSVFTYANWSLSAPAAPLVIEPVIPAAPLIPVNNAPGADANAVPEPASLALVALALAGVGASRRKARAA